MFVGGPNQRQDFHLDESSEFFFQMLGDMELPIIERNKRKVVPIREGQAFLLPSRVPHSPQRPQANSFGLVIERKRDHTPGPQCEYDGLRWYKDFSTCEEIDFERFFQCTDLGKDLLPVINEYKEYQKNKTQGGDNKAATIGEPLFVQDIDTLVPMPIDVKRRLVELQSTAGDARLFGDSHPDKEFEINILNLRNKSEIVLKKSDNEIFILVLNGKCRLVSTQHFNLSEYDCFIIKPGSHSNYSLESNDGGEETSSSSSQVLVLYVDTLGNKRA